MTTFLTVEIKSDRGVGYLISLLHLKIIKGLRIKYATYHKENFRYFVEYE